LPTKKKKKELQEKMKKTIFFFFWVSHVDYLSIRSMNPNQIFRCWQRGKQTKKKGAVA
jgi:hypothetical protein